MEALYPYFLTIHLICAIIFLGYIFTDVVLLSPLRRLLGDEAADRIFSIIMRRGVKIMPICVLLLVITGGAMISRYIGSSQGFFETHLQMLLVIKVGLALCIVAMVITSLVCKFLGVRNPIGGIIHPAVLVLGFCIVILAKLAFYL
ncbi:copper resistance protein CopD [Helicobacter jaachi]|uniref:Copper resistance protein CopD n=1 Tax=Helicobacter jaachi TaxID=1677920 RepID=A0A4U8T5G2_9HELI|nr:copper resistance protein CopD [Helicobacter jaachi]TLD94668.1 copper resistance protein CopD [Helicobacter jaachi]